MLIGSILAVVFGALLAASLATVPFFPVSRHRLERFASRHRVVVTVDNGPILLRYLAATWAWRVGGLLIAFGSTVYAAWWHDREIQLDYVAALAGWFVGAVLAEWRVERVATSGSRRVATLLRRRASDYLAGWMIVLPVASYALVATIEVIGLVNAPRHRVDLLGLAVTTVLSAAGILTVGRHVVRRPLPHAPDLVAADEARRAASLHMLAGAGIAIGGYLLAGLSGLDAQPVWVGETTTPLVPTLFAIVLPALGVVVALVSRPYRDRPVPAGVGA